MIRVAVSPQDFAVGLHFGWRFANQCPCGSGHFLVQLFLGPLVIEAGV